MVVQLNSIGSTLSEVNSREDFPQHQNLPLG